MSTPACILVVDDEKLIRWSVGERLQRGGYEVLSAETGEEALALLGSHWSLPPLLDATPERARDDLARSAAAALALVARSARGDGLPPVPEDELSAVDSVGPVPDAATVPC